MTTKFDKQMVVKRLGVSLREAQAAESEAATKYRLEIVDYRRKHKAWKKDVVTWVQRRVEAGRPFTHGSSMPSEPSKPRKPHDDAPKHIERLISQVECIAGDEIALSKGLLDGIANFL